MSPSSVDSSVACPRCAALTAVDAHFCARCGLALPSDAAIAAPPAGPPEPPDSPAGPPSAPPPAPPVGPAAPSQVPATGFDPARSPSAVGRRATSAGWVGVALLTLGFLGASSGVVMLGARTASSVAAPSPSLPLARFDQALYDGATIAEGTPFTIEVEAVNRAAAATDRVWMVIDWSPNDLASTAGVSGSFVSCVPADCSARGDAAGARTIVSWPGLAAGDRRLYRVTVAASGLQTATSLRYRVSTGTGATDESMLGGMTWDLELEVQ